MTYVNNLDAKLGGTLYIFHNDKGEFFLIKHNRPYAYFSTNV
jgi:hypothetical protein